MPTRLELRYIPEISPHICAAWDKHPDGARSFLIHEASKYGLSRDKTAHQVKQLTSIAVEKQKPQLVWFAQLTASGTMSAPTAVSFTFPSRYFSRLGAPRTMESLSK